MSESPLNLEPAVTDFVASCLYFGELALLVDE